MTTTPPTHLGPEGLAFWTATVEAYALDASGLILLDQACSCLDTIAAAREVITKEGLIVSSQRGGSRLHPAVVLERDSRLALLRVLAALNLEPTPEAVAVAPGLAPGGGEV